MKVRLFTEEWYRKASMALEKLNKEIWSIRYQETDSIIAKMIKECPLVSALFNNSVDIAGYMNPYDTEELKRRMAITWTDDPDKVKAISACLTKLRSVVPEESGYRESKKVGKDTFSVFKYARCMYLTKSGPNGWFMRISKSDE